MYWWYLTLFSSWCSCSGGSAASAALNVIIFWDFEIFSMDSLIIDSYKSDYRSDISWRDSRLATLFTSSEILDSRLICKLVISSESLENLPTLVAHWVQYVLTAADFAFERVSLETSLAESPTQASCVRFLHQSHLNVPGWTLVLCDMDRMKACNVVKCCKK